MKKYNNRRGVVSVLILFAAVFSGQSVATMFDFTLEGGYVSNPTGSSVVIPDCWEPLSSSVVSGGECLEFDQNLGGVQDHGTPGYDPGSPVPITVAGFGPVLPDGTYDTWQGMQWDSSPFLSIDTERSRLEITMPTGDITVGAPGGGFGPESEGSVLTHYNSLINEFDDSLNRGLILETFTLYEAGFVGDPAHELWSDTLPFVFTFVETFNGVPLSQCGNLEITEGRLLGPVQQSDVSCDDVFTLLFPQPPIEREFEIDGTEYTVRLRIEGLQLIEVPGGIVGLLVTEEDSVNDFRVLISVKQPGPPPIPEPASLALLGLGLLGLGAARRKGFLAS